MILKTKAKCPYCGFEWPLKVEDAEGKKFVLCYPEDGGCDKWYVVFYSTKVTTTSHKIEGQELEKENQP